MPRGVTEQEMTETTAALFEIITHGRPMTTSETLALVRKQADTHSSNDLSRSMLSSRRGRSKPNGLAHK